MHRKRKTCVLTIAFAIALSAPAAAQIAGAIGTATWTAAQSPVHVAGRCTVAVGDTLFIEPGVTVLFAERARLSVRGVLRALGSETDSILFLPEARVAWGGIGMSGGDSSTIRYARFSGCVRDSGGAGGAIAVSGTGTRLLLEHSVVRGNQAEIGGGMYVQSRARATINATTVSANQATASGGLAVANASAWISGSSFEGNHAVRGGGVDVLTADITLLDCSVIGNSATGQAGGLWLESSPLALTPTTARLERCRVSGNSAQDGAGLLISGSASAVVDSCVFIGNTASERGGAMHAASTLSVSASRFEGNHARYGGAVHSSLSAVVMLERCTLIGNEAAFGGAVYSEKQPSVTELLHCTAVGNTASFGGAVYLLEGASVHVVNSIVWGNASGQIYNHAGVPGVLSVAWSCVEGGYEAGQDVLDADPRFVNAAGGDVHLLSGSPCIDAGDPASTLDPDSTRADIGAFHHPGGVSVVGSERPSTLALRSAVPNPFNAVTTLSFDLPQAGYVSLRVFTITGQFVRELVAGNVPAGTHSVAWDGMAAGRAEAGSGVYVCLMRFRGPDGARSLATRMTLVR